MSAPSRVLSSLDAISAVALEALRLARDTGQARVVIGIAGAPGAGKSTLSADLVESHEGEGTRSALVPMDGFHLPQRTLVELGRRDRMGAPDTFDVGGFVETLRRVRTGHGAIITAPGFDRVAEEPAPGAVTVHPDAEIIIVEGNYLLLESSGWGEVAALLDVAMVVEIARPTRLERLIARHIRFGKNEADARAWALGPDDDNARLVDASAHRADYRVRLA